MAIEVSNVLELHVLQPSQTESVSKRGAERLAVSLRKAIEDAFSDYEPYFTPQTLEGEARSTEYGSVITLKVGVRHLRAGEQIWQRKVKCYCFRNDKVEAVTDGWLEDGWSPNVSFEDASMWHVIELPGDYSLVLKITEWLEPNAPVLVPVVVLRPSYQVIG